ncbi:DUF4131 domain-containing protein [Pseudomonas parakoreensis]
MLLPFRSYPLAFLLFGFSWACVGAQSALNDRLPAALDGETRWVEGRVVGLPQTSEGVVRFELADARSRHEKLPSLMRLAWHAGPPLNSGERWRLAVKLKRRVACSIPMRSITKRGYWRNASARPARSKTVSAWPRPVGRGATAFASACLKWTRRAGAVHWRRWCSVTAPGSVARIGRSCRTPAPCICW